MGDNARLEQSLNASVLKPSIDVLEVSFRAQSFRRTSARCERVSHFATGTVAMSQVVAQMNLFDDGMHF